MSSIKKSRNCFQLKADFFPLTVIKITDFDLTGIFDQLTNTIKTAPKYFYQAPMVVDINAVSDTKKNIDLEEICKLLREQNIIPVGIRGLDASQHKQALDNNIAVMSELKEKAPTNSNTKVASMQNTSKTANKIITKPVRAGTRVYAKDGDLIILAAVNAGGECIADGNIHVYGPLRGRALAGASGNPSARIFCNKLEAELISIAGRYKVNEDIKSPKAKSMIQIYLNNESLTIESI